VKGTQLGVAATLLMLLCSELYSESVAAYMLPMMIVSTSLGLVLPNAMAVALRPFPHIAGTASSLMGFIQMSTSAVASAAVGSVLTTTPRPMVVAMVIISILALTLNVIMYKRVKTMV
jgi:DHA1 family bicyclomycin/chloramphenicol resistance-like MFS transporter